MAEEVNHPPRYNKHPSGIEAIDVIERLSFNVATGIKYLWRLGHKEGAPVRQEIEKAHWYFKRQCDYTPTLFEPLAGYQRDLMIRVAESDPESLLGFVLRKILYAGSPDSLTLSEICVKLETVLSEMPK